MSLYGMMRTGISGMDGQANKLSATADNIANSSTTGYKRFETLFSTQVVSQTGGAYHSGGVTTTARQMVSQQGVLNYTISKSDLAIEGQGFFIVEDANGSPQLTRAGSFIPNADGELINGAGYKLLGYSFANGTPTAVTNGYDGLEPVKVATTELVATPSTTGNLNAGPGNLSADAAISTGPLPSANSVNSEYSNKTSFTAYDNLGSKVIFDVYYTKTATGSWEVAVYDSAGASAGSGFPYASGPITTATLAFDASGKLTSPGSLAIAIPNGASLDLDISKMKQLGTDFVAPTVSVNGNAPLDIDSIEISKDGTVYAAYSDGTRNALYRIPLANVVSPDQMRAKTGNVFTVNDMSGDVHIGFANEGKNGQITSGALENSTVDIATELTAMIEAQRNYTANSKVFQTASELTDVVINLKR